MSLGPFCRSFWDRIYVYGFNYVSDCSRLSCILFLMYADVSEGGDREFWLQVDGFYPGPEDRRKMRLLYTRRRGETEDH